MDFDEFDSLEPYSPGHIEVDEGVGLPESQTRVAVSLSWQQIALILSVNAVLSLIISLAVVIIAGSNPPSWPGAAATSEAAVSDAGRSPETGSEGETNQAQPPATATLISQTDASVPASQPTPGEALPKATPVEPTIYIVQPGDTLSNIARNFEVSLEDLLLANGLTDPDYVQVGQELLIPIGGLPPATPTFTPVPVPTDTPLPFNPPTPLPSGTAPPVEPAATVGPTPTPVPTLTSASTTEIRLVLQVLNPGGLADETVQIVNQGPFVRLTGWTLSDEAGNVYTFPDFSLWGGGAINVHTTGGSNTITDLYWGQPDAVWEVGDLVTLSDAEGTVIATYVVPGP